jgi:hypothetical protein
MKTVMSHVLSFTIIIVVFTSCNSKSPSITKNNKIKMENQPNKKFTPDDDPDYFIITNRKAPCNTAHSENILLKNTTGSKTTVTKKGKASKEKFAGKQNRNIAAVPIVRQGKSYQQTASDKIYEDDTVKRRQVYGTEKIIAENTSILPGEKGTWHAVQTNENNLVASLYKQKGINKDGATKNRTDVPGNVLPIVEVDILQAGLSVVNSDKGLAIANLHLFEINQQGDSSCFTKNNSLPGEFEIATPGNAAMITSSAIPRALFTGELNIEIVRADIWAAQQKNSLPGNAAPSKNLSAKEIQQAYESLRTILNGYDLPETKAAWKKICADMERGKEHYIVNIAGQIAAPVE